VWAELYTLGYLNANRNESGFYVVLWGTFSVPTTLDSSFVSKIYR